MLVELTFLEGDLDPEGLVAEQEGVEGGPEPAANQLSFASKAEDLGAHGVSGLKLFQEPCSPLVGGGREDGRVMRHG
jgi:hypothetical protein